MKFRKKDFFKNKDSYPVMTIMSREFKHNTICVYTICVYKIPKYYIVEDVKAKIIQE